MTPRKHPNIILCTCDQLRPFEMGCHGNPVIRTPHLDRLAREGVRFETAVSNCPVCMPARSALLTGQFARTCTGRLGNYAERDASGKWVLPEYPSYDRKEMLDPTLADCLREVGYDTALIGKWHIQPAPNQVGFDYSLFPRVHHRHTDQIFVENSGEGEVVKGWSLDYEAENVGKYIDSHRDTERPFFLYYNISPPHMPLLDAPEKYLTMYSPEEVILRDNVWQDGKLAFDENYFKIYLWDFLYYDQHLPETERLPEGVDLRKLTAWYYGLTTWADEMVGRMMASLERNGMSEDTVVVFLSDHGDHLGSHGHFNKGLLIEESIRIPMLYHAPGRLAPQVNQAQIAQIVDVMPSLLDLCGFGIPESVQGKNLGPVLRGEAEALDDPDGYIESAMGEIGIRTATHLYGVRMHGRASSDEASSFYDLAEDPLEMENLAGTGREENIAAELHSRLKAWDAATPWFERE